VTKLPTVNGNSSQITTARTYTVLALHPSPHEASTLKALVCKLVKSTAHPTGHNRGHGSLRSKHVQNLPGRGQQSNPAAT
jgi:hypothetical protein